MSVESLDISDKLTWQDGLPHPEWDLIQNHVEAIASADDSHPIWVNILRQWVEQLGRALGDVCRIDESDRFLLLAPQPELASAAFLTFAEKCRQALLAALPGVTEFPSSGKQVVLILPNLSTYYKYLTVFYPEGKHGGSGGIHIRHGYPHIVTYGTDLGHLENTLAHEMTHSSLCHLTMPQWIEEGLAQMFEHNMTGRDLLLVDGEMAQRHKRYWSKHGLAALWEGIGFSSPGSVQNLSYQLAEILLRVLVEDHQPQWFGWKKDRQRRFFTFLREAIASDGGEAAARAHLGMGLSDIAARFLGPGQWDWAETLRQ